MSDESALTRALARIDELEAQLAIAREVVDERSGGTRLFKVCMGAPMIAAADDMHGIRARWDRRASEFAAPYRQRIAELEAENKALREQSRLGIDELSGLGLDVKGTP